jgi:hypothetical protein
MLEQTLARHAIITIASGVVGQEMKLYLFACTADGTAQFLVEIVIVLQASNTRLTALCKSNHATMASEFMRYCSNVLESTCCAQAGVL